MLYSDRSVHMNRMFLSHWLFCCLMIYWINQFEITKSMQIILLTIAQMFLTHDLMYKPKSCVMNVVDVLSWFFILLLYTDRGITSFLFLAVGSFVMSKMEISVSFELGDVSYLVLRVYSLLLFALCFCASDIFINVNINATETNMIRMLYLYSNVSTRWLLFGLHEVLDEAHAMSTVFETYLFCAIFVLLVVFPHHLAVYAVFGIACVFRIVSVGLSLNEWTFFCTLTHFCFKKKQKINKNFFFTNFKTPICISW